MLQLLMAGLVLSIPAIDRLPGGDFTAAVVDLGTGRELASTGENDAGLDSALTVLGFIRSIPAARWMCSRPDLGEGQASSVGDGWDLYGLVEEGPDYRNFILMALSPSGRGLGLVLLSDELCCAGKADLALMLLWEEALRY
ncbi:MAG: hypothetical protein R6U39_09695 [Candidatus Aegiribacteria sp.]